MSSFGDLYRAFPAEIMDLCLRECIREQRKVFYVDEYEEFDDRCGYCQRQRLFTHDWYSKQGMLGDPWPNNRRDPTCGDPQCMEFEQFFHKGPDAYARRKRFRLLHKAEPEWLYPIELRVPAMLAFILQTEANEKVKSGRLKQSA